MGIDTSKMEMFQRGGAGTGASEAEMEPTKKAAKALPKETIEKTQKIVEDAAEIKKDVAKADEIATVKYTEQAKATSKETTEMEELIAINKQQAMHLDHLWRLLGPAVDNGLAKAIEQSTYLKKLSEKKPKRASRGRNIGA